MQRAKHSDRRQKTRQRLLLGEAVERAGASHLPVTEIIAVLAAHLRETHETAGESTVAREALRHELGIQKATQ